mmetsp:Transcript_2556/g.6553  ORF Transcript_2556/g.6553 Transcript_2556/m.6553 type:complete len:324 (+) Transcript_2556:49-1020(+)
MLDTDAAPACSVTAATPAASDHSSSALGTKWHPILHVAWHQLLLQQPVSTHQSVMHIADMQFTCVSARPHSRYRQSDSSLATSCASTSTTGARASSESRGTRYLFLQHSRHTAVELNPATSSTTCSSSSAYTRVVAVSCAMPDAHARSRSKQWRHCSEPVATDTAYRQHAVPEKEVSSPASPTPSSSAPTRRARCMPRLALMARGGRQPSTSSRPPRANACGSGRWLRGASEALYACCHCTAPVAGSSAYSRVSVYLLLGLGLRLPRLTSLLSFSTAAPCSPSAMLAASAAATAAEPCVPDAAAAAAAATMLWRVLAAYPVSC